MRRRGGLLKAKDHASAHAKRPIDAGGGDGRAGGVDGRPGGGDGRPSGPGLGDSNYPDQFESPYGPNGPTTLFAILLVALVLFIWGRWRYDIVAAIALLTAVFFGIVP